MGQIRFCRDEDDEIQTSPAVDHTALAITELAQSVQALAQQQPTIDFTPMVRLIKQVQESQERIIKYIKEPQPKKAWWFQVEKQSNGNMTIEAKEK